MKTKNIILFFIVFFQIILLTNMTPSESYMLHQTDNIIDKVEMQNKNLGNKVLNFGLNLLIGFLTIKQIGTVSADSVNSNWDCCLKTKEGAICQDIAPSYSSDCASDSLLVPAKCENVGECKPGCCFDPNEGLCTTNSPKAECEKTVNGVQGEWNEDPACLIDECQKSCCVLGNDVQFVNEKRCKKLSSVLGFKENFKGELKSEIDCLALKEEQKIGACVLNGACSIKTEVECL